MMEIANLRLDGGTQSRAEINADVVAEYADALLDPATVFPPVLVYFDGKVYWLADGFHRVAAWKQAGRTEIPAEVKQGTRRDAVLASCMVNSRHGLRRSNADKRRAVLTLLEDAEWSKWSDGEIAKRSGTSREFVNRVRGSLTCDPITSEASEAPPAQARTFITKHGTQSVMDTSNIGNASKPDQEEIAVTPLQNKAETTQSAPEEITGSKPDQEPLDPAEAKARRDLAKLTTDALIDEVIGLRATVADERAKRKAVTAERDDLKAKLAMHTADDKDEVIRRLSADVKTANSAKWRATEDQGAAMKQVFALKKRVAELEGAEVEL